MKEGFYLNKDLNFEYIEDFAEYIVSRVEEDEELFVSVVGKFEEIKNIIKEIMCIAEVDFENINIESPIMGGYEDEYVLDCWCDEGIVQIGCEPAKRDGEYLRLAGDETYLLEDCSSKIIRLCEGSNLYFVNFDDECDCDECDKGRFCECCHNSVNSANIEEASYNINGKAVTEDEFIKKYKEFYEMYEKNVENILNDYCNWINDFNNLFEHLW